MPLYVEAAKVAEDVQFLVAHWGREIDANPVAADRAAYVGNVRAKIDRLQRIVDAMAVAA
jgi:hypothetical protein